MAKGIDCAVLDPGPLDGLREAEVLSGRAGLVEGLVSSFLSGLPERVEQLLRASSEGDARQVRRVAHLLKGGSGSLGASRLSGLAGAIELAAAAGDSKPPELDRLMAEVAALQRALKERG